MAINGGTGKNNLPGGYCSFLSGKRGSRLKCSCRILRGICNCTNTVYQLFFSSRPQHPSAAPCHDLMLDPCTLYYTYSVWQLAIARRAVTGWKTMEGDITAEYFRFSYSRLANCLGDGLVLYSTAWWNTKF